MDYGDRKVGKLVSIGNATWHHRHFDIRGEDREKGKLQKVVFFLGRVARLTAVIINTDFFDGSEILFTFKKPSGYYILFGIFKSKPHTGLYVCSNQSEAGSEGLQQCPDKMC